MTLRAWDLQLQTLGAFRLGLGADETQVPVQLLIPVQLSAEQAGGFQPGEEVLFLRKGQIREPNTPAPEGVATDGGGWHWQDTWWVVDNGRIETNAQGQAVARTASPPYGGEARHSMPLVPQGSG